MAVLFVILFQYVYFSHLRKERTCGQVWSSILRICALCSSSAHTTVSSEQTHHGHTPGAVGSHLRAVQCLAQGSHLSHGIEGGRECCTFTTPPTIPASIETQTCDLWVTSTVMLASILFYRSFSHCSYFETEHGVECRILSILKY